jgi:hypothetical protein
MALCFWVVNKERLQQPICPEDFMITVALNQAQMMRQQLEDDSRTTHIGNLDKKLIPKTPHVLPYKKSFQKHN